MIGFGRRRRVQELMDRPDVDPRLLRRALHTIRLSNRYLGGTRVVLWTFDQLAGGWAPGRSVVVADLGTGTADVPRALVAWGEERGFDVRVVALDSHARTIRSARAGPVEGVELVRGDALRVPLAAGSVDYAMCSQLLHHLSDEEAARALLEMRRIARSGLVVHDLCRNVRAWLWIALLTRLFGDPITRFDGPASIRQAYRPRELAELARRAGLEGLRTTRHFGHRFVLWGEWPEATARAR